jgi:hypothetical protein
MRHLTVLVLGALALAACSKKPEAAKSGEAASATASASAPAAPASTGPITPPPRKAGLWVQTVTTEGRTQEMKLCLDAATDKQLSAWGQQVSSDMCEKNVITPAPGGWHFESVCSGPGGGKSTTVGDATGDFGSKYTVKAKVTTEGSSMPQVNTSMDMTMQAAWQGPCPSSMKPGDMAMNMPGMKEPMVINAAQMAARMKK